MYLSLGLFFLAPHLTRQRKFYAAFFSKLRKFRKADTVRKQYGT